MNLQQKYEELCGVPSDIFKHLPTLKKYSEESTTIVELGVRYGDSTIALLAGNPGKMTSYDIAELFDWKKWKEIAKEEGTDFNFIKADVLDIDIESCDLLFIDTLHNYDQLKKELLHHGNKAQKYIIFHDTTSFEWYGESYDGTSKIGIWPAIEEFLQGNPHWKIKERFTNNNGLTVLARQ